MIQTAERRCLSKGGGLPSLPKVGVKAPRLPLIGPVAATANSWTVFWVGGAGAGFSGSLGLRRVLAAPNAVLAVSVCYETAKPTKLAPPALLRVRACFFPKFAANQPDYRSRISLSPRLFIRSQRIPALFRLYLQLLRAVGFSCRLHGGSRCMPLVVTPSASFRQRLGSVLSVLDVHRLLPIRAIVFVKLRSPPSSEL